MSIYTRRGDSGETSLSDGSRVRKDAVRVDAYGAVDEANSFVGLARAEVSDALLEEVLRFTQQRLFNCSASLASPLDTAPAASPVISADDIAVLEQAVDRFDALTGALAGFVIEGGTKAAANLHAARAVVRRAERRCVTLDASEPVDTNVLGFLNRLSDMLFAAARYANALAAWPEESWDAHYPRPALKP